MLIRRQQGVSLIEVIIGVALLAMLMGLGVPQYATFLANARLKAATDTLVSGLSLARAEAVKRNARVEMVLTDEEPIEALVNALPASTSGVNWVVREWVPRTNSYNYIEGKSGAEGSGKQDLTATTMRVQIASAGTGFYDGMIMFNGFGGVGSERVVNSVQTVTYQITNPSGGLCAAAGGGGGPMRCLTVRVSAGGQIRTCDPAVNPVISPTDTRAC